METRLYKKILINKKKLEVRLSHPTLAVLGLRILTLKLDMTFFKFVCFSFRDTKDIFRKQRQKDFLLPQPQGESISIRDRKM